MRITKEITIKLQGYKSEGYKQVKDGEPQDVTVTLDVDLAGLAYELGQKAARNKHGKSQSMNGKVRATVNKRN